MPVTVVPTSLATVAIATFMTELSRVIRNWPDASVSRTSPVFCFIPTSVTRGWYPSVVVRYVSGNGDCHHHGSSSTSIDVTHLTHQNPRRPGATRRAGAPWPAESGTPPACVARRREAESDRGN